MSAIDPPSVPPPGWTGPTAAEIPAAAIPTTSRAASVAQEPTDAAIRWRISAAFIDNVLITIGYLALCLALRWRVASVTHLAAMLALDATYHVVQESRGGQTIGKRRYGLRVVSVDDTVASPKAIAIRSALRFIDALPTWYASGLVSLVRTGPRRRQRIGDIAAGTKVIADAGVSMRGTPKWYLPVATLAAVGVSALSAYGVVRAGDQPLTAAQSAEWIAGCNNSTYGRVDCQCVLTQLEAAGYTTVNNLRDLSAEFNREATSGQVGSATSTLRSSILACR
jgi:uncharacterized RDD family membrane protein YckC